jgi:hypothetical protein
MEQTVCSETSAYKIQTPGNYPEENIRHTDHGESLKSRSKGCTYFKTSETWRELITYWYVLHPVLRDFPQYLHNCIYLLVSLQLMWRLKNGFFKLKQVDVLIQCTLIGTPRRYSVLVGLMYSGLNYKYMKVQHCPEELVAATLTVPTAPLFLFAALWTARSIHSTLNSDVTNITKTHQQKALPNRRFYWSQWRNKRLEEKNSMWSLLLISEHK